MLRSALALLTVACLGADPMPPTDLKPLAEKYRVEFATSAKTFSVKTAHGAITGKAADPRAVERYLAVFMPEFQLYPADLIKRTKLRRVVFCEGLAFAGQLRASVPDFEHDALYVDVVCGAESKLYQRRVIHHEFFHIIDLRDDGLLYRDERWAALNPAGFKYGTGGKNAQAVADTAALTDKYPGFLNHYSTTGVEEDKAEIFATLLVENAYLVERLKTDRVLGTKVARMKELMKAFCPEVDEKFWERGAGLERPN